MVSPRVILDPGPAPTASCVVIGNEILSGKVRDSNSHRLSVWLRRRGVDLVRVQVIPDVVDTIAQVVGEESRRSGVVFTSGGVGPTHDDLTYKGVAQAFGLTTACHPQIRARMEAFYGGPVSEVRLRMAELPAGATIHDVEGFWVPVVQVHNVYVLPGVPLLFERMLDALDTLVASAHPMVLHSVYTQQAEEELAPLLEQVLAGWPAVEIGSYPRMDRSADHRVRVTLESRDAQAAAGAVAALTALLDPPQLVRVEGPETPGNS